MLILCLYIYQFWFESLRVKSSILLFFLCGFIYGKLYILFKQIQNIYQGRYILGQKWVSISLKGFQLYEVCSLTIRALNYKSIKEKQVGSPEMVTWTNW